MENKKHLAAVPMGYDCNNAVKIIYNKRPLPGYTGAGERPGADIYFETQFHTSSEGALHTSVFTLQT